MEPTAEDIQNLTAAIENLAAGMQLLFGFDLDVYGTIAVGSLVFWVNGFVAAKVVSIMRRF